MSRSCSSQNCVSEQISTFHVQLGFNCAFSTLLILLLFLAKIVILGPIWLHILYQAKLCFWVKNLHFGSNLVEKCCFKSLHLAAAKPVFLIQNRHFTSIWLSCSKICFHLTFHVNFASFHSFNLAGVKTVVFGQNRHFRSDLASHFVPGKIVFLS